MQSLGFLLFFIVLVAWLSPKSLGAWLAKVEAGYRATLTREAPHE